MTHDDKIRIFTKEMNRLAGEIGLEKTNFASVNGLMNKFNISTAKDIAFLSCVAMEDPLFRQIVKAKTYISHIKSRDSTVREVVW